MKTDQHCTRVDRECPCAPADAELVLPATPGSAR